MAKSKLNVTESSQSSHQKEERIQKTAFFTVLSYCLLIIFLPILGFFTSKQLIFDRLFDLTPIQSNIYSAVVAVISLHLALFLYIYRAYFESDPATQQKGKKKD